MAIEQNTIKNSPFYVKKLISIIILLIFIVATSNGYALTLEEEVLQYVKGRYYQQLNMESYTGKTVNEIVHMLPDRYSRYLSPSEFQKLLQGVQGQSTEIGMELTNYNGIATVTYVFPNSPAAQAGIQPEDQLLSVNGQTIVGTNPNLAIVLMNQQETGRANLVIRRDNKLLNLEVISFAYSRQSVTSILLENKILLVKISGFNNNSYQELQNILNTYRHHNLKGYIIDLRNNTGGTVQAAIQIAGELVGNNPIMQTVDRERGKRILYGNGPGLTKPTVVLVNNKTASSAEILTAAIKDNNKGIIFGDTTYGKGMSQTLFPLSNGGALSLTTSEYLTPSGTKIEAKGVQFDYKYTQFFDQSYRAGAMIDSFYLYPNIWGFNTIVTLQPDRNVVVVDWKKHLASSPKIRNK
ncbi:MAG: S41 family peptidase, partial [Bacillota bacterium]|nr:S41 family peptidase [Bacillota bacterium]